MSSEFQEMNVAQIREEGPSTEVEVLFWDSPRVFLLQAGNDRYSEILEALRSALDTKVQVKVSTTEPHGNVIENVQ